MKNKKERSLLNRFLNATCFLSMLASCLYMIFLGFNLFVVGVIVGALIISSIPLLIAGESALGILTGTPEALIDGAVAIFDGFASLFDF